MEDDCLEVAYGGLYDHLHVGSVCYCCGADDSDMEGVDDDWGMWDDVPEEDDQDDDYGCEYCEYDDEPPF